MLLFNMYLFNSLYLYLSIYLVIAIKNGVYVAERYTPFRNLHTICNRTNQDLWKIANRLAGMLERNNHLDNLYLQYQKRNLLVTHTRA